jgi:hypothetical protein
MGLISSGGWVLTTSTDSVAQRQDVDEKTLKAIADILKIPPKRLDNAMSIYVFRDPVKKPPGG